MKHTRRPTYSVMHVLLASTTQPMPAAKRLHQLTAMWQGLRALEQGAEPSTHDWRVCSDAVNLMETLVKTGEVKGTDGVKVQIVDTDGLIAEAVMSLAKAGQRNLAGGQIRLDGAGIKAVRAVLEDYASALDILTERVMVQCHRDTELRVIDILNSKPLAHDVKVMAI